MGWAAEEKWRDIGWQALVWCGSTQLGLGGMATKGLES